MIRVEFHCHTSASKDSLLSPAALVAAARRKGLDRVIITDHNSTAGALEARRLAPDLIIVGEEIMTTQGELLAAFVREELPKGLPPEESIRRLRQQGAFISVSHPFDVTRGGHWQPNDLERITPLVDAIETFNARCVEARFNAHAQAFAAAHALPGTAGSDAHTAFELGRAVLCLPQFSTADELRQAIRSAQPETCLSSPLVHFASTWAKLVKKVRRAP